MGFVKSINIMKVRAKFECDSIEDQPDYQFKLFKFTPVLDGGDENKSFSKYTPAGLLELCISYDTEASNFFELGEEYYLDFSKA